MDAVAEGEETGEATLRVLRVSHSSVLAIWRSEERCLAALGAEVNLVTVRRWAEGGGEVLKPLPGERVTGVCTIGRHPSRFLYDPVAMSKALRSVPHDVLDLHEEPYSVAAAEVVVLRWLIRRQAPLVICCAQDQQKRQPLPVRIAERIVLACAKGAYSCNEASAANLRRKGFRGIVQVIPVGVDLPPDTAVESNPKVPAVDGAPPILRIGCSGCLTAWKDFHVVVDAIAAEPRWRLLVIGEGTECSNVVKQARNAGVAERVELLGFCDAEAMARFYRSIDVLVVSSVCAPGLDEQFDRIMLGAMAVGVPVLSGTSGSIRDVIHDAGVLVPPGNVNELRQALAALERDPEWRSKVVEKGLRRARSHSWDVVAGGQMALFRAAKRARPGTVCSGPAPGVPEQVMPPLDVVVVAYGRAELLERALTALRAADSMRTVPVKVVDNSSSHAVRRVAESHGAFYTDPGRNLGFAAAVNLALIDRRTGSDVLLLNPDAEVDLGTVRQLQARLHSEARVACVAPSQRSPDGRSQRVSWAFPTPARAWLETVGLGRLALSPKFLIGSVLLLNGAALSDVGAFDDRFFLYAEETDWQRRARNAGWGSRLCGDLSACHVGAASSEHDPEWRDVLFRTAVETYLRKWYGGSGWEVSRAAIVLGALLRAAVLPKRERKAALRRAWCYTSSSRSLRARGTPSPSTLSVDGTSRRARQDMGGLPEVPR